MKKILFFIGILVSVGALASGEVHLDKAPVNLEDHASLQRGAKHFVTQCLSCHGAQAMRYNRMQDIGLSEQQIKDTLILTGAKVGDTMQGMMNPKDAKMAFGVAPPDLSVISRSRGADWLYTYLRGFYRDPARPTGWNNIVFDKVAMPHVLAGFQGEQTLQVSGEGAHETRTLALSQPGSMSPAEFDAMAGDLVNYLVFVGEPARMTRTKLGVIVLLFLGVLFVLTVLLKKEFWKDIH